MYGSEHLSSTCHKHHKIPQPVVYLNYKLPAQNSLACTIITTYTLIVLEHSWYLNSPYKAKCFQEAQIMSRIKVHCFAATAAIYSERVH